MIKKLIFSLFISLVGITASADAGDNLSVADSAYYGKNYVEAINLYQAEIDSVGPSSDLHYNLGNCYYRLSKPGKAVVEYQRALLLNPANKDAKTNLDFINSRLVDRPGERGSFITNLYESVAGLLTPDAWAWIAALSFLCVAGGVLLYFFTSNVTARKAGFFGGAVMLIICVATLILSLKSASLVTARDRAVVVVPSTILSTSPRVPSKADEEAMKLHEGALLKILDSVTTTGADSVKTRWMEVEFDNNHRAWINSSDIEVI